MMREHGERRIEMRGKGKNRERERETLGALHCKKKLFLQQINWVVIVFSKCLQMFYFGSMIKRFSAIHFQCLSTTAHDFTPESTQRRLGCFHT